MLHQEAGVDDRFVFGMHRLGDRLLQIIVARVIFVLAIGNHARRSSHGQECFFHADAAQGLLEIVDVLLQFGLAGIGDRPHCDGIHDCFDLVARIEVGVELRKSCPVDAARERIGRRLERPAREPAEAK